MLERTNGYEPVINQAETRVNLPQLLDNLRQSPAVLQRRVAETYNRKVAEAQSK